MSPGIRLLPHRMRPKGCSGSSSSFPARSRTRGPGSRMHGVPRSRLHVCLLWARGNFRHLFSPAAMVLRLWGGLETEPGSPRCWRRGVKFLTGEQVRAAGCPEEGGQNRLKGGERRRRESSSQGERKIPEAATWFEGLGFF